MVPRWKFESFRHKFYHKLEWFPSKSIRSFMWVKADSMLNNQSKMIDCTPIFVQKSKPVSHFRTKQRMNRVFFNLTRGTRFTC